MDQVKLPTRESIRAEMQDEAATIQRLRESVKEQLLIRKKRKQRRNEIIELILVCSGFILVMMWFTHLFAH